MKTIHTSEEFQQLFGQRQALLAKIKCRRLAHSGQRLVVFLGVPLGVVQRRGMTWVSPNDWLPFYSLADASISVIGWTWHSWEEEGSEGVRRQIAAVREQAAWLGVVVDRQDWPEEAEE